MENIIMAIPFTVKCHTCGHVNRPCRKISHSVIDTLVGVFDTCRGCGKQWDKIIVPNRPLVQRVIHLIKEIKGGRCSSKVEIRDYTKKVGRVPKALAI